MFRVDDDVRRMLCFSDVPCINGYISERTENGGDRKDLRVKKGHFFKYANENFLRWMYIKVKTNR